MPDLVVDGDTPLRVTCLIGSLKPNGAERVLVNVVDWLSAQGATVEIVTVEPPRSNDLAPSPAVRHHVVTARRGRSQSVRRALMLPGTRRALLAQKPHVVLSFLSEMNVAALLVLTGTGVPVVVSERVDFRHHAIGPVVETLRRATYGRAAAVVVQTRELLRWVEQQTGWRGTVIPNAVIVPPVMSAPDWLAVDRHTLLAMGRLERQKGFDVLIRAFGDLADRHPTWDVVIAGEGRDRATLELTRSQLGLESRVHMPGRVDPPWGLVDASDLFVLSSRYEGFPNALAEAMAAGVPVVATDCPTGPSDLVRPGIDGDLVAVGDVGALAAVLDRYMGDADLRAAAGARAVEVADRYAPDVVLPEWGRLLVRVARSRAVLPIT
ncbi:MAG: glycosyltransferase family 4 protein [Solirubrobacteraceae bacterium]